MKNDAINLNMSVVNNGENYECGFHMTTSDGLDISTESVGKDYSELVDNIINDIADQMDEYYSDKDKSEKDLTDICDEAHYINIIDELELKNRKLESEVEELKNIMRHNESFNAPNYFNNKKKTATITSDYMKDLDDALKILKKWGFN